MDAINEQRMLANEISEAISNPMGAPELDEVKLIIFQFIANSPDWLYGRTS